MLAEARQGDHEGENGEEVCVVDAAPVGHWHALTHVLDVDLRKGGGCNEAG